MTASRPSPPDLLKLEPIDDRARSGGYQLVFGAGQFAAAKWTGERWSFPGGKPLHFEPEGYRP